MNFVPPWLCCFLPYVNLCLFQRKCEAQISLTDPSECVVTYVFASPLINCRPLPWPKHFFNFPHTPTTTLYSSVIEVLRLCWIHPHKATPTSTYQNLKLITSNPRSCCIAKWCLLSTWKPLLLLSHYKFYDMIGMNFFIGCAPTP